LPSIETTYKLPKDPCVFSKNVDNQIREDILHHTGFSKANSLGKYLGADIAPRRTPRGYYSHIINKIQKQIEWLEASMFKLSW